MQFISFFLSSAISVLTSHGVLYYSIWNNSLKHEDTCRASTDPRRHQMLPLNPTLWLPHSALHSRGGPQWSLAGSRRAGDEHHISQRQAGGTPCEQRLQAPQVHAPLFHPHLQNRSPKIKYLRIPRCQLPLLPMLMTHPGLKPEEMVTASQCIDVFPSELKLSELLSFRNTYATRVL